MRRRALIIVDPQRDFIDGALGGRTPEEVEQRKAIIRPIRRMALEFASMGDLVVVSFEAHPPNHCSFTTQGGPWEPHGELGTEGAMIDPGISSLPIAAWVRKGADPHQEAYSAFDGNVLATGAAMEFINSTLDKFLLARYVDSVIVCGYILPFCVTATAIHSAERVGRTEVWLPAVAPFEPEADKAAIEKLRAAGVSVTPYTA